MLLTKGKLGKIVQFAKLCCYIPAWSMIYAISAPSLAMLAAILANFQLHTGFYLRA
jgi:hypothetical protein